MANDGGKNRQRKRLTGTGQARRAAENIDNRSDVIDAAMEGRSPRKAKRKADKRSRKQIKQDRADPNFIQKILDAVFG